MGRLSRTECTYLPTYLDGVEVVGLRGAPVPDGAGARTLVALVAAVVRGRGWVVMVDIFWVEVEELWCWAPPAVILACRIAVRAWLQRWDEWLVAQRTTGPSLWGRGIPLRVR